MAGTEIKVKIKAYDEGFAAGMKSMQRETDKLKARLDKTNKGSNDFGATLGALKSKLGALGLAFGGGKTVVEGFRRTVESTQSTADELQRAIYGANAGVEHFFQTLATGDWSNFLDGMKTAINYGRDFYDIIDTLGDMKWAFDPEIEQMQIEFNDLYTQIQDSNTPLSERKKLYDELSQKANQYRSDMKALAKESENAFKAGMSKSAGVEMDDRLLEIYRSTQKHTLTRDGRIYDQIDEVGKRIKQLDNLNKVAFGGMGVQAKSYGNDEHQQELDNLRQKMERLKKRYPDHYKIYEIQDGIKDEEREENQKYLKEGKSYEQIASSFEKRMTRLRRYLDSETKKNVSAGAHPKVEADPFRTDEFLRDTDGGQRQELQLRKPMTVPITPVLLRTPKIIAEIEREIEQLQSDLINAGDADTRRAIRDKIGKKQADIKEVRSVASVENTIQIPELPDPTENLDNILSANIKLVDSFGSLGAAIGSIAGDSDNAITSITQWMGTVLSAVGAAIPAIEALTLAHKAKATAQAEDAITGAGASVANIPVVGAIMAVSAIAAVIAAMANMPKFESGGVVRGASHTGDKILARLNAGELVLNSAQQTRLGHIIDRADVGGGVGGSVEFKIRGEELVGVLNKHGRRASRT